MSDLDERLRGIDRLSPPDLWWDAQRRAVGRRASGRDHARRLVTIVVSLVIGLAGVAVLVVAFDPDERTPTAPVDERIVFSSIIFPNNPGQIFSMAPDGTDLVRLTSDLASYSSVSISPDDSRMAYVRLGESGSDGGWGPEGIYVANGDGTKAREIFRSAERPQSIADLAWSPDGQTIGFVLRSIPPGASSEGEWTSRLWVVAADGSNPHPVSDEQIISFSSALLAISSS